MFSDSRGQSFTNPGLALPSPAGSFICHSSLDAIKTSQPQKPPQRSLPVGLSTPPAETDNAMGTTYEVRHLATCENYPLCHSSIYASSLASSDACRSALSERVANEQSCTPHHRYAAFPSAQPQDYATSQPSMVSALRVSTHKLTTASSIEQDVGSHNQQFDPRCLSRASPSPLIRSESDDMEPNSEDSSLTIHSMAVPGCISPNGGNLADFMAEMTALFWFVSDSKLAKLEKTLPLSPGARIEPLTSTAAADHFKTWVTSVLSTTQVTLNVAILALLYIRRLKQMNPTVKGRPGSEYRLLTVALMLGNKFLDDNTYTNKTWADVSGIPVKEIHVMEVEFLSNMRYRMLVSAEEWEDWINKLSDYWSYLQASRRQWSPSPSPLRIPSPTLLSFSSPLPSPTAPSQSTSSLSAGTSFQSSSSSLSPTDSWNDSPFFTVPPSSPLALKPQTSRSLKRPCSHEDLVEPPTKRTNRVRETSMPRPTHSQPVPQCAAVTSTSSQPLTNGLPSCLPSGLPVTSRSASVASSDQGRLSVPSLTLNTNQAPVTHGQTYPPTTYVPQQSSPLSLPPLVPSVRAMSTVYPATTCSSSQAMAATCGPVTTPTTTFPPVSYSTPTKRLSPQHPATTVVFGNSSPIVDGTNPPMSTPNANGAHTPVSHSPSYYLRQRNSPYGPVRHVNTLLYPPPSAFLQQYHLPASVLPNQMHYRPLGKRAEYRTGIVPEFTSGAVVPSNSSHLATTQATNPSSRATVSAPTSYAPRSATRLAPY